VRPKGFVNEKFPWHHRGSDLCLGDPRFRISAGTATIPTEFSVIFLSLSRWMLG
jgi:hypothetical protein